MTPLARALEGAHDQVMQTILAMVLVSMVGCATSEEPCGTRGDVAVMMGHAACQSDDANCATTWSLRLCTDRVWCDQPAACTDLDLCLQGLSDGRTLVESGCLRSL